MNTELNTIEMALELADMLCDGDEVAFESDDCTYGIYWVPAAQDWQMIIYPKDEEPIYRGFDSLSDHISSIPDELIIQRYNEETGIEEDEEEQV